MAEANEHNSTSGTYLELTQAGIIGTMLFVTAGLWSFISPTGLISKGEISPIELTLIGTIVASHGWVMCFVLGAAFDVLPFIHRFIPFEESSLKSVQNLNLGGTIVIFVGLISGNLEFFYQTFLIGMSAFAFQYVHLWNPIRRLLSNRNLGLSDPVGIAGVLPGITIVIGSMICLIAGLDSENLGTLYLAMWMTIDLIWIPICWALSLSYFNRRRNWNIVPAKQIGIRSSIIGGLVLIHLSFEIAYFFTYVGESIPFLLRGGVILALGLMLNPQRIIMNSIREKHYSALIVVSCTLIPIIGVISVFLWSIDSTTPRMFIYIGNGFLLIIPIGAGIATGYISTLHEDHLHRREENRTNGWPTSIIVLIATVSISSPFLREELIFETLSIRIRTAIIALPFLLALFRMYTWWKEELIPKNGSWERIPMFWDEIHQPLDPYEFESE